MAELYVRVLRLSGPRRSGTLVRILETISYIRTTAPQPHWSRGRELLAAHPELRELAKPDPSGAFWTVGLVVVQLALAVVLRDRPWWLWVPLAYIVGATIDHALWALIHEYCHNLVLRSRVANRLLALVANIPLVVPGAMSFFKYHMLHHRHLGEMEYDCGVPGPTEARLIGHSSWKKALWIAGNIIVTGVVRPRRMKKVQPIDGWTLAGVAFQIACMVLLVKLAGWMPLAYLGVATVFAIGLHPLGGRWVQEHFALAPDQETYSYYGPMNKLAFNLGYHSEHHDLITIPWSSLPRIRQIAPEFYQGLRSYDSWSAILLQFIRLRDISLFSYIVRPDADPIAPRATSPDPATASESVPVGSHHSVR